MGRSGLLFLSPGQGLVEGLGIEGLGLVDQHDGDVVAHGVTAAAFAAGALDRIAVQEHGGVAVGAGKDVEQVGADHGEPSGRAGWGPPGRINPVGPALKARHKPEFVAAAGSSTQEFSRRLYIPAPVVLGSG